MKSTRLLLVILFMSSVSVMAQIPTAGLVAYWPFNGNADDESGSGYNGTVNGVVLTADRFGNPGKAYSFSNPGYISVATASSLFPDQFTISYWFKINSYFGERGVLSCVGANGGYQQYFSGTSFAYLIGYNFPNSGSYFSSNYTMSADVNTWHHLVVTYEKTGDFASVTKLYINGDLKTTDNQPVAIAYPGGETLHIGQNHGGVNFTGELDDIRIYNTLLSETDIQLLFNETTVGVAATDFNSSVVAYPNPSNDFVTVDLGLIYDDVLFEIYNAQGQLMKQTSNTSGSLFHVELNGPSGMYYLKVVAQNKTVAVRLLKK
ncbi:MAG: LamG-like jellyroll fold domain-containing protein [Bacteroidia bacterium]